MLRLPCRGTNVEGGVERLMARAKAKGKGKGTRLFDIRIDEAHRKPTSIEAQSHVNNQMKHIGT